MIDLTNETPLTLTRATKYVPARRGHRVAPSTVWRWIVYGHKGVKLEGLRTPAGWFTSVEALGRFFAELAADDAECQRRPKNTKALALAEQQARARLEAEGFTLR